MGWAFFKIWVFLNADVYKQSINSNKQTDMKMKLFIKKPKTCCFVMLCDYQALYDTSSPPVSSSPARDAAANEVTSPGSGPETVVESQRRFTDDISSRHDENDAQLDATENNVSSR